MKLELMHNSCAPLVHHELGDRGRRLFLLTLNDPNEPLNELERLPACFVCLLLLDAELTPTSADPVVEALLRRGARYFCVWGQDCRVAHDVIEEIAVHFEVEGYLSSPTERDVIMSTAHADETLEEALWYAIRLCGPHRGLRSF